MSADRWTPQDLAEYQARQPRGLNIAISGPPKRSKFGAKKTEVDGIIFDSKREATRYYDLRVMQSAGLITGLTLQVRYDLVVNGEKIGRYTSDFNYYENGQLVVEDTKGVKTRDYVLRKKLMKAIYGIEIREV